MKKEKKMLLIGCFVLVMLSMSVMAQVYGKVKGNIIDRKTKKPLENVEIAIVSTISTAIRYETKTDAEGKFFKSGLKNGTYTVTYQLRGYNPAKSNFRLRIGEERDLSVALEKMKPRKVTKSNLTKKYVDMINAGKFEDALEGINKLFSDNPDNEVLYYYRGYIHYKLGDNEKAIADYRKAIELKKDFVLPLTGMGKIYAKQSAFDKAVEYYGMAYEMELKDVESLYNYGVSLFNLGNSQKALEVFNRLIDIDPKYADGYYQLGLTYLGLGDNPKAKAAFEKQIELDPDGVNAATAREILKSL